MTQELRAEAAAALPGWYAQGDGGVWLGYWDGVAWRGDGAAWRADAVTVAGPAVTAPSALAAGGGPVAVSLRRLAALTLAALVAGVLVVTLGILLTT